MASTCFIHLECRFLNLFVSEYTVTTPLCLTVSSLNRATSNGDTSTATLTVNIEDVNDEVPQISGQFTVDIDEALPIGTVVPIILTVVDGDAADIDALVYSISGKNFPRSGILNFVQQTLYTFIYCVLRLHQMVPNTIP